MADALPGQVADNSALGQRARPAAGYMQSERLGENVRRWFNEKNSATLDGALAFVPFVLQQAYHEGQLDASQIVIHRGSGGVVFSDASGFTALTEKLAKKSNGAELLSQCLTMFFTPLIDLINAYRGDTIKFSGDALTIYFPSVDDTRCSAYNGVVPPHGSYGLPDLGPMATAVLRASACCIEIHKRLHEFETGVDDVRLCLHIGVGCGEIQILQVGGLVPPETHVPRMEYLISGAPLEQISIAEPLAKNGETCLSPQAWEYVKDCVIEGKRLEDRPDFHLLERMDESKYTFPTIKYATQLYDTRHETAFTDKELSVIRRYVPSAVFKQIEFGTLQYVNEMRTVSVIFISGSGLDVMSEGGPAKAQQLMAGIQRVCYSHEGTLNKFLIDDKGMLFLLVFGLPPLVHPDDPTRAVLASVECAEVFRSLGLVGRFGVTTGRSYCGVCGSAKRMEYTVLGDCVNLSARLMSNAPPLGILCDEETSRKSTDEVLFNALPAIKVKGKTQPIPIFQPIMKEETELTMGLTPARKILFPWSDALNAEAESENSAPAKATVKASKAFSRAQVTKAGVQMLCGLRQWAGMVKVMEMLGGVFNPALHQREQTINPTGPRHQAPPGSPFALGGVVVIDGTTGLGKVELAEHIVTHCATQFHMMPIFAVMGPRPHEFARAGAELLRTTIAVFRHLNDSLPEDNTEALEIITPPAMRGTLQQMQSLLRIRTKAELTMTALDQQAKVELFDTTVKFVLGLLNILKKQTPVIVVLQFEYGTSLHAKTMAHDLSLFWRMTQQVAELVQQEKQLACLILCKEADKTNAAVQQAVAHNWVVSLKGLSDENINEYVSKYLGVPEQGVPPELRKLVSQVTLGSPLYIRETLDQLMQDEHLTVKAGEFATLKPGAVDRIDIASWNHTAMVGSTVCLLESLDPIQSSALKMSTCFEGCFSLPDLAASSCSPWGGATRFDLLRLFRATQKLIRMGIIEVVEATHVTSEHGSSGGSESRPFGKMTYYQVQNLLVRTVGAAMVLEAQRKSVKRNALIDRVLKQDLPDRMMQLQLKKSVQHIPWYYERALRRMTC